MKYGQPTNIDYKVGLLVGEIIWLSDLRRYTELRLTNAVCMPEEKSEYERLNEVWYQKRMEKQNDNEHSKKEWEEYRKYARDLHIKYFPKEVKFGMWTVHKPENIEHFYKGIESFLWDTDECGYSFKQTDIKFDVLYRRNEYMEIIFTLSYLTDEYKQTANP